MVSFKRGAKQSKDSFGETYPINNFAPGPASSTASSNTNAPPSGQPAPSADMYPKVGPGVIPQIIVGTPSPVFEPIAIADRYRSVRFRPDTAIDGWTAEHATVRGASQRGHVHRYNGAPRQDEFAVHRLPGGRIIVLVADGVSEAEQSHLGASVVIQQATDWLYSNAGGDLAQLNWSGLVRHTAYALSVSVQQLLGLPEPDAALAEQHLATTFVCAVLEPASPAGLTAHIVSIGDSGAWIYSAGDFLSVTGAKGESEGGISSTAVTALPRVPSDLSPVRVDIRPNEILLIGTDGFGDPLGSGHGGVGTLFRDLIAGEYIPSILEFAHALDFSREGFDDDRTLVAIWPRSAK